MNRVTFDFETGEIIFNTDAQQGTEIDPHLKDKQAAIMQAAGYETIKTREIVKAINNIFMEEYGHTVFAEPSEEPES